MLFCFLIQLCSAELEKSQQHCKIVFLKMEVKRNSRCSISEKAERRASLRTQQPFPRKENSAGTAQKMKEYWLGTEYELLKVCTSGQTHAHVQSCSSRKQLQLCAGLFWDLASSDRDGCLPKHLNPNSSLDICVNGGKTQFSSKYVLTLFCVKISTLRSYSFFMLQKLW